MLCLNPDLVAEQGNRVDEGMTLDVMSTYKHSM
jgi:hypothetical protein